MALDHFSGGIVVYGTVPSSGTDSPNEYNPAAGASLSYAAWGMLDNSVGYSPGQSNGVAVYGWVGPEILTIQYAPVTKNTAAISALANAASGQQALISTSANGVIVGQSIVSRGNGQTITGLLALDGPIGYAKFGTNGTITAYDVRTTCGRAVTVTGVSGGAGGTFTVRGYDYLGFPMQEDITAGAGVNTVSGKKAFKYIFSVTAGFTDAHNYSIGTSDTFGFPIRADGFEQIELAWNGVWEPAATGTYTYADLTTPATATTGDVRGTYLPADASNSSKVFALYQCVPAHNQPGTNTSIYSTLTTNGTTAVGNATLHFASVPSWVAVGMSLYDSTVPLAIPVGTTVLSFTSTTIVMSANANLAIGGTDTIQVGTRSGTVGVIGQTQYFTAQTVGGVTFG